MSYEDIGKQAEEYVTRIFKDNHNEKLIYHNLEHTRKVVQRAVEIALFYKMDEESLFIIKIAAWFHDTGYLFVGYRGHERESVRIVTEFILDYDISPKLIDRIKQAIMATKENTKPVTLADKILCDADTFHFGTVEFKKTDTLIRKEIELTTGSIPANWVVHTIDLLKNHRFHTSYCIERLEPGKKQNIAWLESLL